MTTTEDIPVTEDNEQPQDPTVDPSSVLGAIDLPELLTEALAKAVPAELNAVVKGIAKSAVAEMLTDDVRAELAEAARHRIEVALNTDPAEQPEQAQAETGAGETSEPTERQDKDEEEPEPWFADVRAFVEDFVAQTYRRDAHKLGAAWHWCPKWWLHGEALARFRALHAAFEKLRLGTGTEQAAFWVQFFDPMMDRIFDPQGPFQHCSIAEGHNVRDGLAPLTVVAAPDSVVASDRDGMQAATAGDAPAGFTTAAGGKLYIPQQSGRRTRVVPDFPDGPF